MMIEITFKVNKKRADLSICGKTDTEKTVGNGQHHLGDGLEEQSMFIYLDRFRQKNVMSQVFLFATHPLY